MQGGAIYAIDGTLTISQTAFTENTAVRTRSGHTWVIEASMLVHQAASTRTTDACVRMGLVGWLCMCVRDDDDGAAAHGGDRM